MKHFALIAAMISLFGFSTLIVDEAEARRHSGYKKHKKYKKYRKYRKHKARRRVSSRSRRKSRRRGRGGVILRINLRKQIMGVYVNGRHRTTYRISSGKAGFATPKGNYAPKRFAANYVSRKYGSRMPHSVFFRGGYAIHATGKTKSLGRRASHGCIRLSPGNAAAVFSLLRRNRRSASIRIY